MSKGKFRRPIEIKLSDLEVPHGDTSFVVQIKAYGYWGEPAGTLPIAYFGYIKDGIFYVQSYSYSVKNITSHAQESYNDDPQNTAMIGLGTASGILLTQGRWWR